MADMNATQSMDTVTNQQVEVSQVLEIVYTALKAKGYNPTSQMMGYIMSGDPTYITSFNGARSMIMKVERAELLDELLQFYFSRKENK